MLRGVQIQWQMDKEEAKLLCNFYITHKAGLNFKAEMQLCCCLHQSRNTYIQNKLEP